MNLRRLQRHRSLLSPAHVVVLALLTATSGTPPSPADIPDAGAGDADLHPIRVRISPRQIPVLKDVDMLVFGGTTGAAAAAAAAARTGASVVLLTPFPYLGEDITGTLRIECEDPSSLDTPLSRAIFGPDQPLIPGMERRVPFHYRCSLPSVAPHPDTAPPSLLQDMQWNSARLQSVQYNGDPVVTLDLERPRIIEAVHVLAYHKRDFQVAKVSAAGSTDGKTWTSLGEMANTSREQKTVDEPALDFCMTPRKPARVRFLRITVRRRPGSRRVLLGEIVPIASPDDPALPAKQSVVSLRTRPARVKAVLADHLLQNGVEFFLSCYPLAVLRNEHGQPCGMVVMSRSGPFAIRARVMLDGTWYGSIARLAGARVHGFFGGNVTFERTVIGAPPPPSPALRVERQDPPLPGRPRKTPAGIVSRYPVFRCRLSFPLRAWNYQQWMRAEHFARDATWSDGQERASDVLFCIPPFHVKGWARLATLPPSADFPRSDAWMEAFHPAGVASVWLLSPCADLGEEAAARLTRPGVLIRIGTILGKRLAEFAKNAAGKRAPPISPEKSDRAGTQEKAVGGNESPTVRLVSDPLRFRSVAGHVVLSGVMAFQARPRDVVVAGGGTGGAPAGIAAARSGADTLVIEMQFGLGGVGTLGAITKYYWGYRKGFTAEVEGGTSSWRAARRSEWWRRTLRKAGADIWFGAMACGVWESDSRVRGVLAVTPDVPVLAPARVVVDATGSADLAAAAGAPYQNSGDGEFAVQGTGLPPLYLGADYINTDWTIGDETDVYDVRRMQIAAARMAGSAAFDVGPLVDSRERRRIRGEYVLSPLDQILERVLPDAISQAWSNFDSHGYTVHPVFFLCAPSARRGLRSWIPYRCLLPQGVDGLLVTALGLSAHRDALPGVRMQPDIQNLGYATGVAAALAARAGGHTRAVSVRDIQARMISIGILPPDIAGRARKSVPSPERVAQAVRNGCVSLDDTAAVLARPDLSRPLLRRELTQTASASKRLRYALVLAFLHDPAGVPEIIAALEAMPDFGSAPGWDYKSAGQFGRSIGPADQLIFALGAAGDRRATPAILAKARQLRPDSAFSHFRAVAVALGRLQDPRAVPVLRKLLELDGVQGHPVTSPAELDRMLEKHRSFGTVAPRRNAVREMLLASALFRCGDAEGLGRSILERYSRDWRAHLARYATAVLSEKPR